MSIIEKEPISMAEAKEIVENTEEVNEDVLPILNKFTKLKPKKAKELKKELESLDIIKLKDRFIVKIIDILPQDASDINKISSELSLNEDETNKILKTVKKYR